MAKSSYPDAQWSITNEMCISNKNHCIRNTSGGDTWELSVAGVIIMKSNIYDIEKKLLHLHENDLKNIVYEFRADKTKSARAK